MFTPNIDTNTKAYAIARSRNRSHIKYPYRQQAQQAVWGHILIVPRPRPQRPLMGLRFFNIYTKHAMARFEIISVMPTGLWSFSSTVCKVGGGQQVAVPFSPATNIAAGYVDLRSLPTGQVLAVLFRYDAIPRSDICISAGVALSTIGTDSVSLEALWRDDYQLKLSQNVLLKTITVVLAGGVKMTTSLYSQHDANGDVELELWVTEHSISKRIIEILKARRRHLRCNDVDMAT